MCIQDTEGLNMKPDATCRDYEEFSDCGCVYSETVAVLTVYAIDTRRYGSYVTNIDSQCCNISRFRSARKWLKNL